MIKKDEIFQIGVLTKTHGLRGEISFKFHNDIFDHTDCPYLILNIDGIFVPFFIKEYRFRGSESALIIFEDVDSEEKASKLQGLEVYFPRKYMSEDMLEETTESPWDYFIGFAAIDKHLGALGKIEHIDNQTINTLFVILNEEEELLIPAVEEFIVEIDADNKIIHLHLPEGLVD